jgi:hypothetical protein
MLLEHSHHSDDARFAARAEGVKFDIGGDEGGGEFGISSCAGTSAPYLRGDVVQFFAVL